MFVFSFLVQAAHVANTVIHIYFGICDHYDRRYSMEHRMRNKYNNKHDPGLQILRFNNWVAMATECQSVVRSLKVQRSEHEG